MSRTRTLALAKTSLALAAACVSLTLAGAAQAAQAQVWQAPNYVFPSGQQGFKLQSHGGIINPGVIVGFNPQPEPPGDRGDGSLIALLNPSEPHLFNPSTDGSFTFLIGLLFPGDGSVISLPDAPNSDGFTGFTDVFQGHTFQVSLRFGPGQVDARTWSSFNPQPDPPGDVLAGQFQFFGALDPDMFIRITEDRTPLTFTLDSVPEPESWALMILGFGGIGAMLRAHGRRGRPALG